MHACMHACMHARTRAQTSNPDCFLDAFGVTICSLRRRDARKCTLGPLASQLQWLRFLKFQRRASREAANSRQTNIAPISACVRACVRACMRACAHARLHARTHARTHALIGAMFVWRLLAASRLARRWDCKKRSHWSCDARGPNVHLRASRRRSEQIVTQNASKKQSGLKVFS